MGALGAFERDGGGGVGVFSKVEEEVWGVEVEVMGVDGWGGVDWGGDGWDWMGHRGSGGLWAGWGIGLCCCGVRVWYLGVETVEI